MNYALRERELALQEKQAETNRLHTAMMMKALERLSSNRVQSDEPQSDQSGASGSSTQ